MQALVYDPDQPAGLRLAEVAEPVPGPGQALVEVRAFSLNFGELAYRAGRASPGEVHGWDAAGIVVSAAEDGSGPAAGTPVVTFGWDGAWARRRAVSTAELAVLPVGLDPGAAAALPVAGVTALRAVRRLGSVLGRRVLITGASGGVGRFAVQLAARAGAEVVASVGSPARGEGLGQLGAAEIVIGPEQVTGPVHGVLDNVGGQQLAEAFALLEAGGVLLSIGKASGQPTIIDFERERHRSGERRIEPFVMDPGLAEDLAYLVRLLDRGELDPQIGWRGPWQRTPEAAEALLSRRVTGKAVLDIPH
ncbi:zinc-binding dehydrogenase [Frankia sp. CNm7]|uniref:Zinc-binding dehydrogenase n=1 Tax=Frankia nepalensis TaxID=1836974 RepID=A0A937RP08_9ACTN|nr:zinc-binding dehydrogenase [Frankia nepalensis]MBL7498934.1 zinc-binding dehydrogenase [Frankia nepalensis]MBL7511269.1 zinc-binding dehydrogenase [Frankia nepalensis]MBL7520557.1 zinc-binding dehydrogenase [Frankia nepalensis]MBL7630789.1 zinc-binding dehydrogenase [Frankia nepalensis]